MKYSCGQLSRYRCLNLLKKNQRKGLHSQSWCKIQPAERDCCYDCTRLNDGFSCLTESLPCVRTWSHCTSCVFSLSVLLYQADDEGCNSIRGTCVFMYVSMCLRLFGRVWLVRLCLWEMMNVCDRCLVGDGWLIFQWYRRSRQPDFQWLAVAEIILPGSISIRLRWQFE